MELRNLVNAKVEEAGGDTYRGYELAGQVVEGLMAEGKVKPNNFSIRRLFDELVDGVSLSDEPKRVAEGINTSAFPTIARKIIHKDIIDEYDLALGKVAHLVRESEAIHTDEELVAGFTAGDTEPLIRRQGMAYEETDFGEKDWKVILADFGRMISLTREVIYEDRTGDVLKRAKDIGRAAGQHKAKLIVYTATAQPRLVFEEALFGGAIFKGTTLTQATAVAATTDLYSETHATLTGGDGQVNKNLLVSHALVDYTDIDTVYQTFAAMVDEAGNPIDVAPSTMLIAPGYKATAYKIIKADLLMARGSTDLANISMYNPIRDIGAGELDIISSIYMPVATDWYVGDFAKQLLWLNVFAPATASQGASSELAFTNQIVARFRFSYHGGVGHTDWRYIIKCQTEAAGS